MTLVSVLLLVRKGSHQSEVSPRNILRLQLQSPGSGGSSPSAAPRQFLLPSHLCPALRALPAPPHGTRDVMPSRSETGSSVLAWTARCSGSSSGAQPKSPLFSGGLWKTDRQTEEGQWAAEGGEPALLLLRDVREISSAGTSTEPKHGPMSITGSESRDTPTH